MTDPFHTDEKKPDAMEECYAAQRIPLGSIAFQACCAISANFVSSTGTRMASP